MPLRHRGIRFSRFSLLSLFFSGAAGGLLASAAQATPVLDKPSFPTVTYWDNWTDRQGVTHLTQCKLSNFKAVNPAPKKGASPSAQKGAVKHLWTGGGHTGPMSVTTKIQPPGWMGDWAVAKHVERVIPLAGTYFVEATDGTRVELNAGDVLLSEDLGARSDGKGHRGHLSGNVGEDAVALLVMRFPNARATHIACSNPLNGR